MRPAKSIMQSMRPAMLCWFPTPGLNKSVPSEHCHDANNTKSYKANGGVANVKGVIAQVSFSIIWLHILYLVSLKSFPGPKLLYLAFACAPAKKFRPR